MDLELKSDPDGEHLANQWFQWLINGNILVESHRYSDDVVIWVLDDPPWSLSTADTVNLVFEEMSNPYSNLVERLTPLERDHILFQHDLCESGCQNIYHIPEKCRRWLAFKVKLNLPIRYPVIGRVYTNLIRKNI